MCLRLSYILTMQPLQLRQKPWYKPNDSDDDVEDSRKKGPSTKT